MSYENRLGLTQKKARFAQFETFLFLNKPVASRKDASRVKRIEEVPWSGRITATRNA